MREVKLSSGAVLEVAPAPFADAKELFKVFSAELKGVKADPKTEIDTNFIKDIVCSLLASDKVEIAFNKCAARCLYNGKKIDADTFEDNKARQDYMTVFQEICMENVAPFLNGLFAGLEQVQAALAKLRQ